MNINYIIEILKSKPHNQHYLNRYIKFIEYCYKVNLTKSKIELGYIEKHHICPKAKSLFPEYKSKKDFPWNIIILTGQQHFVAHHILAKAYPNSGMYVAYIRMFTSTTKRCNLKFTQVSYENARKNNAKEASILHKEWYKNNNHPKGMLGKNHSNEFKNNMSIRWKGEGNPMYGKPRADLIENNRNVILNKKRKKTLQHNLYNRLSNNCGFSNYTELKEYLISVNVSNMRNTEINKLLGYKIGYMQVLGILKYLELLYIKPIKL